MSITRRAMSVLLLLAACAVTGAAQAAGGYDGLSFKPQMFGRGGAVTEGAAVPAFLDVEAAMMMDIMGPSLKLRHADGSETEIVGAALSLSAMSAVGLWHQTEVGIAIPVVPFRVVGVGANLNDAGIGDIALNLRHQILGKDKDDFKLAAGPVLYFPTGSDTQLTGTGGFSFALLAAVEKAVGPVNVLGNLGFRYQPTGQFFTAKTGPQILIRSGVEYWVLPGSLAVLAELKGAIGIEVDYPMEGYLEVKKRFGPIALLAGGSSGFTNALGVPPWRIFLGASWLFKNQAGPAAAAMPPPRWGKDTDGDGIPDDLDRCPDVPGPFDLQGCPLEALPRPIDAALPSLAAVDKDNDGIPDDMDECPAEAGPELNKGCPVRFDGKNPLSFNNIGFGKGDAEILPDSFKVLDAVVQALKDNPKVKVRVEGHTDNVGNPGNNVVLSQQQALSVMNYLIAKGIEPARLSYIGFGGSQPMSALKTEEGRRQNRRVDFRVME